MSNVSIHPLTAAALGALATAVVAWGWSQHRELSLVRAQMASEARTQDGEIAALQSRLEAADSTFAQTEADLRNLASRAAALSAALNPPPAPPSAPSSNFVFIPAQAPSVGEPGPEAVATAYVTASPEETAAAYPVVAAVVPDEEVVGPAVGVLLPVVGRNFPGRPGRPVVPRSPVVVRR